MKNSFIHELAVHGQSVWLDFIDRKLIQSGHLLDLVQNEGIRGLTSNPSIFEKAIGATSDYDDRIQILLKDRDWEVKELYEELAIQDIRDAADILYSVYRETQGQDGYVSFEVSPLLAHDAEGTLDEARILWNKIARPNILIKVPGTQECIPVIKQLIIEGINVNVTLLFSQDMYAQVAEAYLSGLETRVANHMKVDHLASVASFFVSRIDTIADEKIDKLGRSEELEGVRDLLGHTAIANAKLAYAYFENLLQSVRWKNLELYGAQPQRLLWASTGTKNKKYSDVLYVNELIGPLTVTTLPMPTLKAFQDHGQVRPTLKENVAEASRVISRLEKVGISLREITDEVLVQGVQLFVEPFEKLLLVLEKKRRQWSHPEMNTQELCLPIELETILGETLRDWSAQSKVRRLWACDSSLWKSEDESHWMGWLNIVDSQLKRVDEFKKLKEEFADYGFRATVLLGMGGSSLGPEVFEKTFDVPMEFPNLHILDSTDPDQIRNLQEQLDLDRTLFIVSSKSGTTLETQVLFEYFYSLIENRLKEQNKEGGAGRRFIAITDPGTPLETLAKDKGFLKIFYGVPSIGGRFSVFSDFGLIPAVSMGIDIELFLKRASQMVHACGPHVQVEDNPGVVLGAAIGTLALQGRDKLTVLSSPEIWDFGSWLEQLLAESTGKEGKGVIPICGEAIGSPEVYGTDRQFVYLRDIGTFNPEMDFKVDDIEKAGFPVIRFHLKGAYCLSQEFFRWEMATAVIGSILGINPFNQPDVEASKVQTRKLISTYEKSGNHLDEKPFFVDDQIQLFTNEKNRIEIEKRSEKPYSFESLVRAHLGRLEEGDFFTILAYLEMNMVDDSLIQEMRVSVRDQKKVATSMGFGPRFLHSTGQLYKGGTNRGLFLQLTSDPIHDEKIPGHSYSFGILKESQAQGDLQVLAERGRRYLRIHLGKDVQAGLARLKTALLPKGERRAA